MDVKEPLELLDVLLHLRDRRRRYRVSRHGYRELVAGCVLGVTSASVYASHKTEHVQRQERSF